MKKIEIDKDELYNLYHIKGLSMRRIGSKYHCDRHIIKDTLVKYGIRVKTKAEGRGRIEINRRELEDLYLSKEFSKNKIAKYYNVSEGQIKNRLKEYNIPLRTHKESVLRGQKNPSKRLEVREKIRQSKIGKKRSDETKQKISEKNKGQIPWNKGIKKGEDKRLNNCIRALDEYKKTHKQTNTGKTHFKKGDKAWNKGVECPKGTKQKISESTIKNWQNSTYKNKQKFAMMQGLQVKPNKPEILLNNILQGHFPGQYQYTGDGKVIIEGFCPDFVCNPSKRIVEMYGDYWHNLPEVKERDKRRIPVYRKYGFSTLIIWEHELKNLNNVIEKIREFTNG